MSADTANLLGDGAVTVAIAAFAAVAGLLDWVRRAETPAPSPSARPRAGGRRADRDAPDPATVARDARIISAWQRGEIPGRHAPGGVR